ncbi:multidrug resistance-associated protein 1-like [Octopus sinensis]|uniref:Multidrug resistance-associated protein 1-like n=1 Tax=Octopus sinensis TaxID=2607531 RepID=A0A7E6FFJ2_9MOLL|nr:multidrug resistance-associated protein 1-like [Octopus sinensis]
MLHQGDLAPNAEKLASFPSQLIFWWLKGLFVKSFKHELKDDDMWEPHPRNLCSQVVKTFLNEWSLKLNAMRWKQMSYDSTSGDEVEKCYQVQQRKEPSLTLVLLRLYMFDILKTCLLKFIYDILLFVSPQVMSFLIAFIDSKEPSWKGYTIAVFLLAMNIIQTISLQHALYISTNLGLILKQAVTSTIFRKALTLKCSSLKATSVGETVNLMSVDCQRFQDTFPFFYLLISAPFQMILSLYFLYQQLGAAIFSSLVVLFCFIPISTIILKKMNHYLEKVMVIKDKRIIFMNEVLNGMKVLKLYAWEPSFEQKVNEIRKEEIKFLRRVAYLKICSEVCWKLAPFLIIFATFTTYVLSSEDHKLDPQKTFVSLALFNLLKAPINYFSMLLSFFAQLIVSIKRVQKYLCTDDLIPMNVSNKTKTDAAVAIRDGRFSWDVSDANSFQLKDINITIPKGQLVSIVGSVGTGKSSLASAILGEMDKLNGTIDIEGSIAYVPQRAWIQNNTLKNNILFNQEYNKPSFYSVITACALHSDIDTLPSGVETEIGEKGVNLSGGQQQRVSLARAVYNDADIYILDDPLSAVDSHVGKHIFNKVIGPNGLLKNKTRILVTHAIQWLPQVDCILVMDEEGRISEQGTYEELVEHEGAFAEFLERHLNKNEDAEEEGYDGTEMKKKIRERVGSTCSLTEDNQKLEKIAKRSSAFQETLSKNNSVIEASASPTSLDLPFRKSRSESIKNQLLGKIIETESIETGEIKANVYMKYLKAVRYLPSFFILLMYLSYQALEIFFNIWLSWWSEDRFGNKTSSVNNINGSSRQHDNFDLYIGVTGGLGLGEGLCIFLCTSLLMLSLLNAANSLHKDLLHNILHCSMTFFDKTPIGRILNRFSKDIDTADTVLPNTMSHFIDFFFIIFNSFLLITYTTPIFTIYFVLIVIVFYSVQRVFLPITRQLHRLESVTRSPIYSLFGETLMGAVSVRAYKKEQELIDKLEKHLDSNFTYSYAYVASSRGLGICLDFISHFTVFISIVLGIANRDNMTGASFGLSMSSALKLSVFLAWFVKVLSEMETHIVSVERIDEYTKTENEAAWVTDHRPDPSWPQEGNIDFENFDLRYRPGLELVLKGITCHIKGGEKIGIVGRTGAGKSSLTVSLFRLIEGAGGTIVIDNEPIDKLGLHDLRSRITILPQDPVLFSGSIRMNLDPLNKYTDDQIWQALHVAHLKPFVLALPSQLEYRCVEGGQNLSVGQRQLMCLARSVLKKTRILVLDEATAAVDMDTDDLIQKTIRNEFKNTTILAIAHRLNTILDYDKVMVLDAGKLVEFGKPEALLKDPDSLFYGMVKDAGLQA